MRLSLVVPLLGLSFGLVPLGAPLAAPTTPHPDPFPASGEKEQGPLTLERIMADPDWIGPGVEGPYWMLDGSGLLYRLKREGSPVRDLYEYRLDAGQARAVPDAELSGLDAPDPVFDAARRRAAFVRNGDMFVRDLDSGALTQLNRGGSAAQAPGFFADGGGVFWRAGSDWYGWRFDDPVTTPLAVLKAEKDPNAEPEADLLRERQLRLIATLAREKAQRQAQREFDDAARKSDATRAPAPVYLGEKIEIADSALSPSGRWLLVVTQAKDADKGQAGKLPKYVTESGYNEIEDVRTRVGRNAPAPQTLRLVDLDGGRSVELKFDPLPGIGADPLADLRQAAGKEPLEGRRPLQIAGMRWNRAGDRVAVMLRALDNKDRWLAGVDLENSILVSLHRLTDPAWINWDFNDYGWLADDRTLWLLSEESGHSHLYTLAPGKRAKALTEGAWEVADPVLAPGGERFYFLCNRAWPGDWELCAKDLAGGPVRELSALDGVEGFVLSPDGGQAVLRYSGSYLPPQLALLATAGGTARAITDTRKPEFKAIGWRQPEFVQVPSKHGAGAIWGKLYRPERTNPGTRHPIVLFVHGAGYTQNAHARWPYYFREQMFHNLLVQRGYLVLDLDYRGSAGYGRDWRTAIYRQMGHPELEDYLDGIDYLVERHHGDRERVGLYGGSYGGFMTFMALFRAPEAFKAGAALRPVTDWTSYNHEYTSNILNTPEIDPEAYHRSSPIEFAENLKGRLLIAHGMIDDNVFYQDSVRLAQRLIELRKDGWELAGYPLERHSFVHPESWYDEYRRILELFEGSLE